jgi:hypothetical protein
MGVELMRRDAGMFSTMGILCDISTGLDNPRRYG